MTQVNSSRSKGAEGIVLYSYVYPDSTGVLDSVYQYYKDNVFQTAPTIPDVPWISNPQDGYLRGQITDSSSGDPIDLATVTIIGPGICRYECCYL